MVDSTVSSRASRLLRQTRLLMASRATEDKQIKQILEDLELLLIQVNGLDTSGGQVNSFELEILAEGLDNGNVLGRVRAAVDAPLLAST